MVMVHRQGRDLMLWISIEDLAAGSSQRPFQLLFQSHHGVGPGVAQSLLPAVARVLSGLRLMLFFREGNLFNS